MGIHAEIREKLKGIVGVPDLVYRGVVTEINNEVCSVQLYTGLIVPDVKIKATISGDLNFIKEVPAIGSDVLMISDTGSLDHLTIIKADKLSSFEFVSNGLKVLFDSETKKVTIENTQVNLLNTILKLTDMLKSNYKQYTANGPTSGALPQSIQLINTIENDFKQILK